MEHIQAHNSQLQHDADQIKVKKGILRAQLREAEQKLEQLTAEGKQLAIENQVLQQSVQVAIKLGPFKAMQYYTRGL